MKLSKPVPETMTIADAIRELRVYFRSKAQHADDCVCACCNAIEVLALAQVKR